MGFKPRTRNAAVSARSSSEATGPHFTSELFHFLLDLRGNNDRDWFNANKPRYEREVKAPMLQFIRDFAPRLAKISRHFVADPRPVGGSMFRIYRDVRFARDKRPYKTIASAHFRHEVGKDVHGPGFYLHLEPGNVFMGGGVWRPDGSSLRAIRTTIAQKPETWLRVLSNKQFAARCKLGGDSLSRAPRGFDPEHPLIEDIKRKDFMAIINLADSAVFEGDFLEQFTAACAATAPLSRFLAGAVGLPF